jgi:hypothetical protein
LRSGNAGGDEWVMPPHRKQRVGVASIADAAHDQLGGGGILCGSESGVWDFGDFGVRDPVAGVGVVYRWAGPLFVEVQVSLM